MACRVYEVAVSPVILGPRASSAMPAVTACLSQDYLGTDVYRAIGLLRKTSKLFADSEPGITG